MSDNMLAHVEASLAAVPSDKEECGKRRVEALH
jgi:hypothetical protein